MLTHSRTDLRAPRKNTRHGRPQKQERIERFQKDGAGDWWEKLPEPFDKLAQPKRHQTPKTRKPFSTLNFSRKHKSIRMDTNARVQRSENIPFFLFERNASRTGKPCCTSCETVMERGFLGSRKLRNSWVLSWFLLARSEEFSSKNDHYFPAIPQKLARAWSQSTKTLDFLFFFGSRGPQISKCFFLFYTREFVIQSESHNGNMMYTRFFLLINPDLKKDFFY